MLVAVAGWSLVLGNRALLGTVTIGIHAIIII